MAPRAPVPFDLNCPFQAFLNRYWRAQEIWPCFSKAYRKECVEYAPKLVEWFKTNEFEFKTRIDPQDGEIFFLIKNGDKFEEVVPTNRYRHSTNDEVYISITMMRLAKQAGIKEILSKCRLCWANEFGYFLIDFVDAQVPAVRNRLTEGLSNAATSEESLRIKEAIEERRKNNQYDAIVRHIIRIMKDFKPVDFRQALDLAMNSKEIVMSAYRMRNLMDQYPESPLEVFQRALDVALVYSIQNE